MEIKIKRLSINGISKIDGDNCVIEIPDEELMRLGKRYFELTMNNDKNENPYYLTDEDMMVCARKLKTFCRDKGNCKGCPFVIESTGSIYGCKIGCRTNSGKFYTPDNWEV